MQKVTIDEFRAMMKKNQRGGIMFEPEWLDDDGFLANVYPAITTDFGNAVSVFPDEDGKPFEWVFSLDEFPENTTFLIYEQIDAVEIAERLIPVLERFTMPPLKIL